MQYLGYVNQFVPSSQKPWSEHALELAAMGQACYRAHDGRVIFPPVGQQDLTLNVQEAKFSPDGLTVTQPDSWV